MKRMKKRTGVIVLVVFLAVLVALGYYSLSILKSTGMGKDRNLKLGLDLAGGVSITYEVVGETPSAEDMKDTIYKLQKRIESDLGEDTKTTEASVYQVGDNRITVEIPGVSDANAILEELGTPGKLYFIKHKDSDGNENYSYDSSKGEYVLNKTIDELQENGGIVLDGSEVKSATATYEQDQTTKASEPVVQISLNDEGTTAFADATAEAYADSNDTIGIYYDDRFVSVPAVQASITGHLVVSTLHTNSSANTITRLADMGVENYLIADSVVGVIAQRLVRRVCPACGIVREATAGEKKILGIKDPTRRINVRTPGHKECVRCGGTGYYGRIGIYEIMPVTADLRQAINRGENADVLEEIALTHGMKTLRMSAIDYALRGITTVEEVQRVAYDDEED